MQRDLSVLRTHPHPRREKVTQQRRLVPREGSGQELRFTRSGSLVDMSGGDIFVPRKQFLS